MKDQSELLNQWAGNPAYQSQWDQACTLKLKQLIQQALKISPEVLEQVGVRFSANKKSDRSEVVLMFGDPQSTIIRLLSSSKQPPRFELSTQLHRGEGRTAPRVVFVSDNGLSPRATRATVSVHLELAEGRLAEAETLQRNRAGGGD